MELTVCPSIPKRLVGGTRALRLIEKKAYAVSSSGWQFPTIFHEKWWLDAASGGTIKIAEVEQGGRAVGRLPYLPSSRFGLTVIRPPALTYFLGPAVDEGTGNANTRFLRRLGITRELIGKLPAADSRYIKCHGAVPDVIAFQELGFRTHVQFTHEIVPGPADELWSRFRDKTRNVIRRAQEQFSIRELLDPEEFMRMYTSNLALKGEMNTIDPARCDTLLRACLERGRGRILTAVDQQRRMVAANFCVWDAHSCFYLLSSRTPDAGNGAVSLLLWEAIQQAVRRGLIFDFAGLGGTGSVLFYSGFGATIQPRYVAVQSRLPWKILARLRRSLSGENCFF